MMVLPPLVPLRTLAPFTLANCDQKIVSKLVDIPLARQASHSIALVQSGFVKGRKLQDAVFSIESAGIISTWVDPEAPALVFLDQRAAFPSAAHNYIFWILEMMLLPRPLQAAVWSLYQNSYGLIRFSGAGELAVAITRGIKQGCPLSWNSLGAAFCSSTNIAALLLMPTTWGSFSTISGRGSRS